MNTGDYLPEWKIYLLKKLALDSKKLSARPLTTREFLYVTDQEVIAAREESLHQAMRYIQSIPERVYAGEKIQETDGSIAFSKGYAPPEFKSLEILNALVELSSDQDAPLKFPKIQISKQYFAIQEKKRLASISMGHGSKDMVNIFPAQPIEIAMLKSLLKMSPGLADHIVFQLEIDPAKINKKIEAYLDDFKEQRLIPPKGKRYLTVEEQKTKFLTAIGVLEKRFGKANISTNFTEIVQIVGRENWREELCRFYETLFLLELDGAIKIVDLRGLEVVFSIIRDAAPERKTIEPFDVEKEFTKVKMMKDPVEHSIAQEKWSNVKFILGEIGKILPPLKSKFPQSLSLNTTGFSEAQMTALPYVMEYLLDIGGVTRPPEPDIGIITTEPLRKVLRGEFAIIGDRDAIEEYISQIYELCNRIEENAWNKFSRREAFPISKSSKGKTASKEAEEPPIPNPTILKGNFPSFGQKGNINIGGASCHIANMGDLQYHICKELLAEGGRYKFGDFVSQSDLQDRYAPLGVVVEMAHAGGTVKDLFKSERWLRDAVGFINGKTVADLGSELFEYKASQVRLKTELFE